jgi:hypothetical protein
MFHNIFKLSLLLLLFVLTNSSVWGQNGFYVSLNPSYSVISFDDTQFDENDDNGTGPGLGLAFGYGFNHVLTLMVSVSSFSLNEGAARSNYAEVVGRFHILNRRITPYLEAGALGTYFKYDDVDNRLSGTGVSVGTGLKIGITPKASIEMGIRPSRVYFHKIKVGNQTSDLEDVKTWQTRAHIGVSFYIN